MKQDLITDPDFRFGMGEQPSLAVSEFRGPILNELRQSFPHA